MIHSYRFALTATLVSSAFLVACSSTPLTPPAAVPVTSATPVPVTTQADTQPAPPANLAANQVPPYLDPQNPLAKERSVYFDYDKSDIASKFDGLVQLHGDFLANHPDVAIKIAGNTDERGGSEYNLALGQKRADTVAKALKILGVKNQQIETISYGMEKPRNPGHDEAAYAENRRADLVYPGN